MIIVKNDSEIQDLMKAFGRKDYAKLHKERVTDKNGKSRMVWVSNEKKKPSVKKPGKAEPEETKTVAKPSVAPEPIKKQLKPPYGRKQIPADKFKAAEYKQIYDDETINADSDLGLHNAMKSILELPIVKKHPEFEMKMRYDLERALKEPETITKYRKSGEGADAVYTPEREALHQKIIKKLLSPENIKKAMPKDGEQPTFQILGGRGGSGKSTFNKKKSDAGVYHSDNVIVVDPDELKEKLANASGDKWEGWKAKAYHEESSDVS